MFALAKISDGKVEEQWVYQVVEVKDDYVKLYEEVVHKEEIETNKNSLCKITEEEYEKIVKLMEEDKWDQVCDLRDKLIIRNESL